MADNVTVSSSASYDVLTDDVGGKHCQIFKLTLDADGSGSPVTGTLPTSSPGYSIRMDDGATYLYVGEALPGTAASSAGWRIKRVENSTGNVLWASGDVLFDKVWNDRASLSYS